MKTKDSVADAVYAKAKEHGVNMGRVVFEVEEFPSEKTYFFRDQLSAAYAAITRDKRDGGIHCCVEYPSHEDGKFVTYKTRTIEEMFSVFIFTQAMLDDIRQALEGVI